MATAAATNHSHPKGIYALFSLQLLGMVGFSMIFALMVLYCTKQLGFSDSHAYAISGAFNALAFATSVPGGYLAEKYLGYRFGTLVSIILAIVGMICIAIPHATTLYIGLGCFTFSAGMMLPCLFVLLGNLYGKDHPHREHGFVISYVGMNVGSFIASAISGSIAQSVGYSAAFLLGALSSAMMLPILFYYRKIFHEKGNEFSTAQRTVGLLLTIICTAIVIVFVYYASISNSMLMLLGIASLLFVIKIAFHKEQHVRNKLLVFLLLTTLSVLFWTLYSLAPSALTLFTERNVDRHLFHFIIPTADLSSLNPFFIITLGPLMTFVWKGLRKIKINPSVTAKFGIGTILMGIGYLVLVVGIQFHNAMGYIALAWLVLSYFSQTIGELLVGPVGFAMVGELVPAKMEGTMMGIWQLACGIGGALSEYFAKFTTTSHATINPLITNQTYTHAFGLFGWITIGVGLFTVALAPMLRRVVVHADQQKAELATQTSFSTE